MRMFFAPDSRLELIIGQLAAFLIMGLGLRGLSLSVDAIIQTGSIAYGVFSAGFGVVLTMLGFAFSASAIAYWRARP